MIFYKEPFTLNEEIENKELKNIIKIFRNGNFNDAHKKLKLINENALNENEKQEYNKLKKMLTIDKAGIFAVLFLLTVIIFLFMDFIGK